DALAGALVDDVDRVVLPVRAGDAEEEREPAPEAELALASQLALEDERVPLPPEVLAGLLEHAVDVDLERVRGVGGEVGARPFGHVHRMPPARASQAAHRQRLVLAARTRARGRRARRERRRRAAPRRL